MSVKNSLKSETGKQAHFINPASPDFSKENKVGEDAQKRNDRIDAINQVITQEEAQDKSPNQATDTTQFVRYSVADAYKKAQNIEAKKAKNPTQDTIKEIKKMPSTTAKPQKKHPTFAKKSKRERINDKVFDNEKTQENDGFNTVVISAQKPTESVSDMKNVSQKHFFKAAIYGNQTVRSGSSVRLRLLESLVIDEQTIPANSLCTGIALLGSNRVTIALTAVQVHGQQIGIKSLVFDKDLLPGIAFSNASELQQNIRQQRNAGIDQASTDAINALPQIGGMAGAALSTGMGVVNGISKSIRYGGVQKRIGEITLEEGYKVFIQQ